MTRRAQAECALIAVTALWGASFTLVKEALNDSSTILFLAVRFVTATAAVALFSRRDLRTGSLADPLAWRGGPYAGLCLAAAYVCQTSGLRATTPSRSAFLTSLCTALVPFFAAFVYRNVPRVAEILGITLAILGMGMLTVFPDQPQQVSSGLAAHAAGWGELLTLAGAAGFAAHILITGHFAGRAGLSAFSLLQLATAALLFLLALPWLEPVAWRPSVRWFAAIAVTGVLCTAVAFTVQAWAQHHTTATRAALIFALEPVSAALTSYAVAGEVLGPAALAGAFLILAGIITVELKPPPPGRHPSH